jgi:hypothetical protein
MPFSPLPIDESQETRRHFGVIAWAGLATYVVIYDIIAVAVGVPTLSATFHRISITRRWRLFLVGFWAYLTAHLFRWLPPRYDLFRSLDKPVRRRS